MNKQLWKFVWEAMKGWFLVITGFASLASYFAGQLTGLSLRGSVGLAIVILLLIFLIKVWTVASKALESEVKQHDTEIFNRADKLLPERRLRELLNELLTDSRYFASQFNRLISFLKFFEDTSNYFLNQNLIVAIKPLIRELDNLANFLAGNFFPYPDKNNPDSLAFLEDSRYYLYPELRWGSQDIEQNTSEFKKHERELDSICYKIQEVFKQYRLAVKNNLIR